jgi:hypothetical protein
MTVVRLVDPDSDWYDEELAATNPPLLCSYVYLREGGQGFLWGPRHRAARDWALDSGAYSAMTLGTVVDRDAFHRCALDLLARDPKLVEVFALDVIGDWRATLVNVEAAWEAGIPAIPTYHIGEPTAALVHMARTYPKIALGGVARLRTARKLAWASQCFARVWPKPIHGLGFSSVQTLLTLPFHSADASSWVVGPSNYGSWKTHGSLSVSGKAKKLTGEIRWHLDLEAKARMRWAKELAELDDQLIAANWRGVAAPQEEVPS